MEAAMQGGYGGTATEAQMQPPRQAPEPVDVDLTRELEQRCVAAQQEAEWHEEAARRFRSVESACRSGLETLNMIDSAPQQAQPYR